MRSECNVWGSVLSRCLLLFLLPCVLQGSWSLGSCSPPQSRSRSSGPIDVCFCMERFARAVGQVQPIRLVLQALLLAELSYRPFFFMLYCLLMAYFFAYTHSLYDSEPNSQHLVFFMPKKAQRISKQIHILLYFSSNLSRLTPA